MKVRVYYDARVNYYYPQYRRCFIWWYFEEYLDFCFAIVRRYDTLNEAINFLINERNVKQEKKEIAAKIKEKKKQNKVVFETKI